MNKIASLTNVRDKGSMGYYEKDYEMPSICFV